MSFIEKQNVFTESRKTIQNCHLFRYERRNYLRSRIEKTSKVQAHSKRKKKKDIRQERKEKKRMIKLMTKESKQKKQQQGQLAKKTAIGQRL